MENQSDLLENECTKLWRKAFGLWSRGRSWSEFIFDMGKSGRSPAPLPEIETREKQRKEAWAKL